MELTKQELVIQEIKTDLLKKVNPEILKKNGWSRQRIRSFFARPPRIERLFEIAKKIESVKNNTDERKSDYSENPTGKIENGGAFISK